eukprot:16948-Heterococcus_DN1.PRE.2
MLQNSNDNIYIFEPDAAAVVAIQAFQPGASIASATDSGRLLQAEVRRQLNLYHKELLDVSRGRRNTMAVAANSDSAGLASMLWQQVFQPVWARVLAPWLQMQKMESNAQEARVDTSGHQKFSNTLAARAIVLRSQVWVGCLVADYQLIEFEGRMLYEFRTTPQLQNSWPLSEKASALVHTLMHLTRASDRMFPGRSLTCHAYKLQGECAVCFLSSASAL